MKIKMIGLYRLISYNEMLVYMLFYTQLHCAYLKQDHKYILVFIFFT